MKITTTQKEGERPIFTLELSCEEAGNIAAAIMTTHPDRRMSLLVSSIFVAAPVDFINEAVGTLEKVLASQGQTHHMLLALKLLQAKKNTEKYPH
jgi:hypothetical protein